MKRVIFILFTFSLVWLASCQKNTTGNDLDTQSEETAAIQSVLEDSTDLFYDGLDDQSEDNIDNDDPNWLGSTTLAKSQSTRLHYGRISTHPIERNVQITLDPGDSTATAYIYTKMRGQFIVRKLVVADSDSVSLQRYVKPLVHEVERIVHLKKFRQTENARHNWKITDISMNYGASPDNTVEIVKFEVLPQGYDSVTVTDPLNYFMNGQTLFSYARWSEIKLRVTVRNTSANPIIYPEGTQATEMVRLIYGRNRNGNFARTPFTWVGQNADGNVYEGSWTVKQFSGVHRAIIDVIDNGTILSSDNETYPYNSNTWSTPYRVTRF